MAKFPTSTAGPSTSASKGKPQKVILKTSELLRQNERDSTKGKGKEREILGDVHQLVSEAKSLPALLAVEQFAKIRSLEILAFQNAIKAATSQGSTRVFQSLPRHLRRRAASHNPRRVPKRLRSRAAAEIDPGDNIAKIHRKRAKIRARGNLRGQSRTEQLLLRQRDKTWLPTHMYHAKRFHMVNLWGHRLPLTPTLKSFRPAYRASRRKAIVHDTSYFGVIELEGERSNLLKLLGRMIGGPFAGAGYESGARMVQTTIYHADMFPLGFIGPISLLWSPYGSRIWIRVHPSIFSESWDALRLSVSRFAPSASDIHMRDLREDLSSFEIVGPQGGRLIKRILKICRDETASKRRFFSQLGDPSSLPPGLVAGIKVYDPRLHFPPPVVHDETIKEGQDGILRCRTIQPSSDIASSPLWDEDIREQLCTPTHKKSDLDHRRHKLGLPGTRLQATSSDDRIPILLIATGSTYTLIIPRGWSNAILQSIVYTATLVGGLEERRAQHREVGIPCFPEHFGNMCKSGKEWEISAANENQRRWARKPPGKRLENPTWRPNWDAILRLNEEERTNRSVPWLYPSNLQQFIQKPEKSVNAFRKERGMSALTEGFSKLAVVHVKVDSVGRGSPGTMAAIYSLGSEERQAWVQAVETSERDLIHDELSAVQKLGEIPPDKSSLIGYTTTGNFSLSRGKGYALGTISVIAWNELSKIAAEVDGTTLIKFKNNGGRLCRLAQLSLV